MATVATAAASDWIMRNADPMPLVRNLPGGMQGEKWAAALDFVHGRCRRAAAEATISRAVLSEQLRVEAQDMHEAWLSMALAKMHAGGLGASFHAANGVAALMLATGQDAAYLTALTQPPSWRHGQTAISTSASISRRWVSGRSVAELGCHRSLPAPN